jgi:hypothetical protein
MNTDVHLARHLKNMVSTSLLDLEITTSRRTVRNTSSRCLGEESNEGNDGGNGELHDFVGNRDV